MQFYLTDRREPGRGRWHSIEWYTVVLWVSRGVGVWRSRGIYRGSLGRLGWHDTVWPSTRATPFPYSFLTTSRNIPGKASPHTSNARSNALVSYKSREQTVTYFISL